MNKIPNFLWRYPETVPEHVQQSLDLFSPAFQSILYQRSLKSMDQALDFLLPMEPSWYSSSQLLHMDLACQLINQEIEHGNPIGIFGDYDADGITSTALLTLALSHLHSTIYPLIPNRLVDGYGINKKAIDFFHSQGVRLIITVDNGIRAHDPVVYARDLGIEMIITDHHSPSASLPSASVVLNPKQAGDDYPNKHLAGVGVAYKLLCGLSEIFPELNPDDYLDLVALGTVADIVPLKGENRYLVRNGLRLLNHPTRRQSLNALIGAAGLTNNHLTAGDISFQIAPRINSSGRLADDDHLVPLRLLLCDDPGTCGKLAQILDDHNRKRKKLSRDLQIQVENQFAPLDSLPPILIAIDEDVDLGVAGIAAGFLARKFYLPAIVGKANSESITASCRSIPEFNFISALDRHSELFTQYGGHSMAAGFTLPLNKLSDFKHALFSEAEKSFQPDKIQPEIKVDASVTLDQLNKDLYKELSKLEPTGEGNPTPVLAAHNLTARNISKVGKQGSHLKLSVTDGESTMPAIGFGLGSFAGKLPDQFNIVFRFTENIFRGRKNYQLQILDISPV
jgi:single-stranded-DNA-specific exonuclease